MSAVLAPPATLDDDTLDEAEGELVARIAQAERAAIGQAYDMHHAAVRAFARRLVGETGAAEDLVHEVFVTLPRAARNFRGSSSLRTFLISIAVNHARHHVRSAARRRAATDRMGCEPDAGVAEDPERVTERKQLAAALTRALDKLPLDQRVAFVLCEVEERKSADAARIVGVPVGTMRTRVFHAKKKLRDELEQEGFR